MPSDFVLEKWYLDAADEARRAIIGYRVALSWNGLSATWQNLTRYAPGERPCRRSSRARGEPPRVRDGVVDWNAAALGATLHMDAGAAPLAARLWVEDADDAPADAASPAVDWWCVAPVATVRATFADAPPFAGIGYAECLTMRVAPWRLPIDELRWGRWADEAGRRSLVWIDWRGVAPRCWTWLDGRPVDAHVDDSVVEGACFSLELRDPLPLEHRAIADVLRGIPGLPGMLPPSMRETREAKWLSIGVLRDDTGPPKRGTALHEVVRLR